MGILCKYTLSECFKVNICRFPMKFAIFCSIWNWYTRVFFYKKLIYKKHINTKHKKLNEKKWREFYVPCISQKNYFLWKEIKCTVFSGVNADKNKLRKCHSLNPTQQLNIALISLSKHTVKIVNSPMPIGFVHDNGERTGTYGVHKYIYYDYTHIFL